MKITDLSVELNLDHVATLLGGRSASDFRSASRIEPRYADQPEETVDKTPLTAPVQKAPVLGVGVAGALMPGGLVIEAALDGPFSR